MYRLGHSVSSETVPLFWKTFKIIPNRTSWNMHVLFFYIYTHTVLVGIYNRIHFLFFCMVQERLTPIWSIITVGDVSVSLAGQPRNDNKHVMSCFYFNSKFMFGWYTSLVWLSARLKWETEEVLMSRCPSMICGKWEHVGASPGSQDPLKMCWDRILGFLLGVLFDLELINLSWSAYISRS